MPLTPGSKEYLASISGAAQAARTARKNVKASLKSGEVQLSSLLDIGHHGVGDTVVGRMEIGQLLRAVPGWGAVKSSRLLEALDLAPDRHVDTIAAVKRQKIVDAVEGT